MYAPSLTVTEFSLRGRVSVVGFCLVGKFGKIPLLLGMGLSCEQTRGRTTLAGSGYLPIVGSSGGAFNESSSFSLCCNISMASLGLIPLSLMNSTSTSSSVFSSFSLQTSRF